MTPTLPLDVNVLIIDWVFRLSQHAMIDYPTLHACALVCRAWTPSAQRLLFRRILSTSLHYRYCDVQLLVRTLETRPHLAAHVRFIRVAWPLHPPVYGTICLRLLELCPHVQGISLWDWQYYNEPVSAELDARWRAIQLRPVLLEVFSTDSSINAVVQMCRGVRTLILRAGYSGDALPPTVESLEIHGGSHCPALSKPLPALRALSLRRAHLANLPIKKPSTAQRGHPKF
ncbi:hypothetical protein FA95DRAFT_1606640 [Auriscalpium vulgare]|uniref:Uncharacterized protein n=1 Tax=Auriscalpium vulgare TaxID=40419 RepID=A0ACB8RTA9_9AGAM|nr:hypothetical protein FA95DRAFT_1606640 [Auriscalpium vulgare]